MKTTLLLKLHEVWGGDVAVGKNDPMWRQHQTVAVTTEKWISSPYTPTLYQVWPSHEDATVYVATSKNTKHTQPNRQIHYYFKPSASSTKTVAHIIHPRIILTT